MHESDSQLAGVCPNISGSVTLKRPTNILNYFLGHCFNKNQTPAVHDLILTAGPSQKTEQQK